MKTNKTRFFILMALAGVMALGPIARADDTPAAPAPATPPAAPDAKAPAGRANMREQMEKMFTAVKATDEQKEKLKPILKDRNEQLKTMRQDTALSPEDKKAKQKEISQAANEKVKAVLSADQFDAFQQFQKDQRKLRQESSPDGAPKK